jgi:general secretion pathway protein L
MATLVGIDIREDEIRVARLAATVRGHALLSYHSEPLDPAKSPMLQALAAGLAVPSLATVSVAAPIPGESVEPGGAEADEAVAGGPMLEGAAASLAAPGAAPALPGALTAAGPATADPKLNPLAAVGFDAGDEVDPAVVRLAALRGALYRLKVQGALEGDRHVVGFPIERISFHRIELPFTDQKRIDQTLAFELEAQLPFELSEGTWSYKITSREGGKAKLLVAYARRDEFAAWLEAVRECGIEPRVVPPDVMAYPSLWLDATRIATQETPTLEACVAILDVSLRTSSLAVVRQHQARTMRALDVGADVLLPQGRLDGDAVSRFVRLVMLSLRADRAEYPEAPTELLLAGEGADSTALIEALGERLGLTVRAMPYTLAAGDQGAVTAPRGAERAIALALVSLNPARAVFNFRRAEFAYKGDYQFLRKRAARLAWGVASLVFLLCGYIYARFYTLDQALLAMDNELCEVTKAVLGTCETDFRKAQAKIEAPSKTSGASIIPASTAYDLLYELYANVPQAGAAAPAAAPAAGEAAAAGGDEVGLEFSQVDINEKRLTIEGTVKSFNAIDVLETSLKKSKCFDPTRGADIRKGRSKRSVDGSKIEFSLTIDSVC